MKNLASFSLSHGVYWIVFISLQLSYCLIEIWLTDLQHKRLLSINA